MYSSFCNCSQSYKKQLVKSSVLRKNLQKIVEKSVFQCRMIRKMEDIAYGCVSVICVNQLCDKP